MIYTKFLLIYTKPLFNTLLLQQPVNSVDDLNSLIIPDREAIQRQDSLGVIVPDLPQRRNLSVESAFIQQ